MKKLLVSTLIIVLSMGQSSSGFQGDVSNPQTVDSNDNDNSSLWQQRQRRLSSPITSTDSTTKSTTKIRVNQHAILQVSVEILLPQQRLTKTSMSPTTQQQQEYRSWQHEGNSNTGDHTVLPRGGEGVHDDDVDNDVIVPSHSKWVVQVEEVASSSSTTTAAVSRSSGTVPPSRALLVGMERELSLTWHKQPEEQSQRISNRNYNCQGPSTLTSKLTQHECRWGRATISFLIALDNYNNDDEEGGDRAREAQATRNNKRDHTQSVPPLLQEETTIPAAERQRRSVQQRTLIITLWEQYRLEDGYTHHYQQVEQVVLTRRLATLPGPTPSNYPHPSGQHLDLRSFLDGKEALATRADQESPLVKVHLQATAKMTMIPSSSSRHHSPNPGGNSTRHNTWFSLATHILVNHRQGILFTSSNFDDKDTAFGWKSTLLIVGNIMLLCVMRHRVLKKRHRECSYHSNDGNPLTPPPGETTLQEPPQLQRQVMNPKLPISSPSTNHGQELQGHDKADKENNTNPLGGENRLREKGSPGQHDEESSNYHDHEESHSQKAGSQQEDNYTDNDDDSSESFASWEQGGRQSLVEGDGDSPTSSQLVHPQQQMGSDESSHGGSDVEESIASSTTSSHTSSQNEEMTDEATNPNTSMTPFEAKLPSANSRISHGPHQNGGADTPFNQIARASNLDFEESPEDVKGEGTSDEDGHAKDVEGSENSSRCKSSPFEPSQAASPLIPDTATSTQCHYTDQQQASPVSAFDRSPCNAVVDLSGMPDDPHEHDVSPNTSSTLTSSRGGDESPFQTSPLEVQPDVNHVLSHQGTTRLRQLSNDGVVGRSTTNYSGPGLESTPTASVRSRACAGDDPPVGSSPAIVTADPMPQASDNFSRRCDRQTVESPHSHMASLEGTPPKTIEPRSRTTNSPQGQHGSPTEMSVVKNNRTGSVELFPCPPVNIAEAAGSPSRDVTTRRNDIDHDVESPFLPKDELERSPLSSEPQQQDQPSTIESALNSNGIGGDDCPFESGRSILAVDDNSATCRDLDSPLSIDPGLGRSHPEIGMGQLSLSDEPLEQDVSPATNSHVNNDSAGEIPEDATTPVRVATNRDTSIHHDEESPSNPAATLSSIAIEKDANTAGSALLSNTIAIGLAPDTGGAITYPWADFDTSKRVNEDSDPLEWDGHSLASIAFEISEPAPGGSFFRPPKEDTLPGLQLYSSNETIARLNTCQSENGCTNKDGPYKASPQMADETITGAKGSTLHLSSEPASYDRINCDVASDDPNHSGHVVEESLEAPTMARTKHEDQIGSPSGPVEGCHVHPRRAGEVLTQYSEEFTQYQLGDGGDGSNGNHCGDGPQKVKDGKFGRPDQQEQVMAPTLRPQSENESGTEISKGIRPQASSIVKASGNEVVHGSDIVVDAIPFANLYIDDENLPVHPPGPAHHHRTGSHLSVKTNISDADSYVSTLPPHSDCSAGELSDCLEFTPSHNPAAKPRRSPRLLQATMTDQKEIKPEHAPETGGFGVTPLTKLPEHDSTSRNEEAVTLRERRKGGIDPPESPESLSFPMGGSTGASPLVASNTSLTAKVTGNKSSMRKKRRIRLTTSTTEPVPQELRISIPIQPSSPRKRRRNREARDSVGSLDSDSVEFLFKKRDKTSPLPFSQSSIVPDWVASDRLQQASAPFTSDDSWNLALADQGKSPSVREKVPRSISIAASRGTSGSNSVQTPKRSRRAKRIRRA